MAVELNATPDFTSAPPPLAALVENPLEDCRVLTSLITNQLRSHKKEGRKKVGLLTRNNNEEGATT